MTAPAPELAPTDADSSQGSPAAAEPAAADPATLVHQDLLVEDVSIDGMCGVY